MNNKFVKNHENTVGWGVLSTVKTFDPTLMLSSDSISYKAGTCGRPCEIHFAKMGIFRRIQVFFRGNFFFFSHCPPCRFTWGVTPPPPRVTSPPWADHPAGLDLAEIPAPDGSQDVITIEELSLQTIVGCRMGPCSFVFSKISSSLAWFSSMQG